MSLKDILDKIFPSADGRNQQSELVERGLEALRLARDERAVSMGDLTRVPSHLELRLSSEKFGELDQMDAVRDLEFFFNDELMRDLSVGNMRTFGDYTVHVKITVDENLAPGELYGLVLTPAKRSTTGTANRSGGDAPRGGADSTRVLGSDGDASTVAINDDTMAHTGAHARGHFVVITGPDDFNMRQRLESDRWVIGRKGSSGRPMPDGFRKLDLDVRETVSREQVRLELADDRMTIQRIGKAPVGLSKRDRLDELEERTLELGTPFFIDDYQVVITR